MPSMPSLDTKVLQSKLLEAARRMKTERLWAYRPYPKQAEHHTKGKKYRKRLLMAGNQQGKTESGTAEDAFHLTGLYPEWWTGLRFGKPIRMWIGGNTATTVRDVLQRKLLGAQGELGTGWIPKTAIVHATPSRGVPGAYDFVTVSHVSGGTSVVIFKSYEQGQEKWQADSIDFLHFDEEPPPEIWTEGMARLTATDGSMQLTFTPLKGMSSVVREFYPNPKGEDMAVTRMGLKDALHIAPERHASILAQYPKHERDARTEGIPVLGSGAVFPVERSLIEVHPVPIQKHWKRIAGMDFGRGDHPTAGVCLAIDSDLDILYVVDTHRDTDPRMVIHADAMRRWLGVPVAWPKDGHSREPNEGQKIADVYRQKGLKMLPEHAQYTQESMPLAQDRSNMVSVEAGLFEMLTRMQDGRFKVFSTLDGWWEEFAMYHRVDGKIVKQLDDLMDATRYAVMARRFAAAVRQGNYPTRVAGYDPFNLPSARGFDRENVFSSREGRFH